MSPQPVPRRLDEIQALLADRTTPYLVRCDLHAERDQVLCTCGHVCGMHGSYDPEKGYVGIGRGPCGEEHLDPLMRWIACGCTRMTEVTAPTDPPESNAPPT